GRSASGRNFPKASAYSKAGVSKGSNPYVSKTARIVSNMRRRASTSEAKTSRKPRGLRAFVRVSGSMEALGSRLALGRQAPGQSRSFYIGRFYADRLGDIALIGPVEDIFVDRVRLRL